MNTSDILKLIDAGYTKAEIEAMESGKEISEEVPEIKEEPKVEELKSAPVKEEEPKDDFKEALKMMTDEMKAMRADFQKHLINSDDMQIADPLAESEKILASIINPPTKKGKVNNGGK